MKVWHVISMIILLIVLCCLLIGAVTAKYKSEISLGIFNLSIKASIQYQLTFDLNHHGGKSESAPSTQDDNEDSGSFTIPDVVPAHEWGTFLGWTTDKNVAHKSYPYTEDYKQGLLQPGDSFIGSGGEAVDNIISYTLYAVWYLEDTDQEKYALAAKEAQNNGEPVVIGGGTWEHADVWGSWNPDSSQRLTLHIYDGEFNDWLIYIPNADVVIYGGVFKTNSFFMDSGTTIKICGGDWTAVTKFTFTEDANVTFTGGTFSYDVSHWVRTEGYACTYNDNDGTYTVGQAKTE